MNHDTDDPALLAEMLTSQNTADRREAERLLSDLGLERFEQPSAMHLLIAASTNRVLRLRAYDCLTRVFRGMDDVGISSIDKSDLRMVRRSLAEADPKIHADYLLEAIGVICRLKDTDSIVDLDRLIQRTTVTRSLTTVRFYRDSRRFANSIEGTPSEIKEIRRVKNKAVAARLWLGKIAEKLAAGSQLLRPATGCDDDLLRPATGNHVDDSTLLRPNGK